MEIPGRALGMYRDEPSYKAGMNWLPRRIYKGIVTARKMRFAAIASFRCRRHQPVAGRGPRVPEEIAPAILSKGVVTIEFARVFRDSSPAAEFSFLSGSGADPTGRSRLAFARYKGQAENALLAAGFRRVYLFRPAYIYPVEPWKEPNLNYRLMRAIYPVFRVLFPNQVIRVDDDEPGQNENSVCASATIR